jgi:hypothetical protein
MLRGADDEVADALQGGDVGGIECERTMRGDLKDSDHQAAAKERYRLQ